MCFKPLGSTPATSLFRRHMDIILVNYDSLRWILKLTTSTKNITHWRLRLLEFELDIVHRAGLNHLAADAPSRLQTTGAYGTPLEHDLPYSQSMRTHEQSTIFFTSVRSNKSIPLNVQEEKSIDTPPTIEKIVVEQTPDECCKAASLNVDQIRSQLHID